MFLFCLIVLQDLVVEVVVLQHKLFFYSFALIIVIGLIRFNKMIGMVVDTIDMSTAAAELMRANRQSNLMN